MGPWSNMTSDLIRTDTILDLSPKAERWWTVILYKRRRLRHRPTQRENHVKTQEEDSISKLRRKTSEKTDSADTLISDLQTPELWENKFLFLVTQSAGLYYGTLRKLIQNLIQMILLFIFYHPRSMSLTLWSATQYLLFILWMFLCKSKKWVIWL